MTLPQSLRSPTATLITPECEALGCRVAGDQYTLVRPAPQALLGLAYYQSSAFPVSRHTNRPASEAPR
ncbi:MAG: hypothetical protein ACLQUY_10285 [Ktedonobacterales bacterium]